MAQFILKAHRNRLFYVGWCTIQDGPVWFAHHREQALRHLKVTDERLDRADETGTSEHGGLYGWDDESIVCGDPYPERRLLPRKDLLEYLLLVFNGQTRKAKTLTKPMR